MKHVKSVTNKIHRYTNLHNYKKIRVAKQLFILVNKQATFIRLLTQH